MSKYTQNQRRVLLAHELRNFEKLMLRLEEEHEELFYRYVYRLLLKVYELNLHGRYMSKMQACRYIPLRHQAAAQSYLHEAEERGFIEMRPNPRDGRKTDIIPRKQLIEFVEEQLENAGDELRVAMAELGQERTPRDNLPLSRWSAP